MKAFFPLERIFCARIPAVVVFPDELGPARSTIS